MSSAGAQKAGGVFRQYLPDLSQPRFTTAKDQDAYSYADTFKSKQVPPWLYNLTQTWERLYEEPYKGVTSDGNVVSGLYQEQDEGVEMAQIVGSAAILLARLSIEERANLLFPINAKEWRAWSNPEVLLRPLGLRLEEVDNMVQDSIFSIMKATLSPEGYAKALDAMRVNHFLGELCDMPRVMNRLSYNFLIFATPSTTRPWGWSLYGHHLCLNVFLRGTQIVISPTFTGAEPNMIDDGEYFGTELLHVEGRLGLKLMQSLPRELAQAAQTYKLLCDPGMRQTGNLATDRWNQDDQRHLCGAFRDNRIVPYEGIRVSAMDKEQRDLVLDIAEQFLLYLPDTARAIRKKQIASHFQETFFSWIGGYNEDNGQDSGEPFYFRIQSPVVILEFDHHSGVFLTNKEPARFHIHTIVRTPNAGDYGGALRGPGEAL
ncbi:hypothetical protein FQN54_000169 [Arachnomyces sp. PD_36]|nr:hypothetical protein FQN54_000169 [Arachnomyces sp. PD_36]